MNDKKKNFPEINEDLKCNQYYKSLADCFLKYLPDNIILCRLMLTKPQI